MFTIIKPGTKIDFVGKMRIAAIASVITVIICSILVVTKMNYGVDFRGGAEIEIKTKQHLTMDEIRASLEKSGLKGVTLQSIGEETENEVLLKVQADPHELNAVATAVEKTMRTDFANAGVEIRKVDVVGAKAGKQLRLSAFLAMCWAFISVMIYLGLRFDFRYAPGVVISLVHDTAIMLGIYALFGFEFSLLTVAAVLAVIGYSLNDTVIVYDRVREHEHKYPGVDLLTLINNATNETLSRTIVTSGATLMVTVLMYLLGGGAIKDFFFAFSIGIVVGTYSSIYVASAFTYELDLLQKWRKARAKKLA